MRKEKVEKMSEKLILLTDDIGRGGCIIIRIPLLCGKSMS